MLAGLLTRFLQSKAVTLVLIAAVAGAAWYVFEQGRTIGELQEDSQALARIQEERAQKQAALDRQRKEIRELRQRQQERDRALSEALEASDEAFKRCFDMRVPDGLRVGPAE